MDGVAVAAILAVVFLVSFVVTNIDPRTRPRVSKLKPAFLYTLAAIPLVGGVWWLNGTGFEPLGGLGSRLLEKAWRLSNEPSTSFVVPWLLSPVVGLVDILITVGIVAGAAIAVVSALVALTLNLPILVQLPFLALPIIGRGLWTVVRLPVIGVAALLHPLTRPKAVRDIHASLSRNTSSVQDTARQVNETLTNEVRRALKTRWWRPNLSLFTSISHYNRLAAYIRSLSEVAEATNEHLKKKGGRGHGKGS